MKKILIVDDDKTIVDVLGEALGTLTPVLVSKAYSFRDCVSILEHDSIGIVLADYLLDGTHTAKEIKTDKPLYIMTAMRESLKDTILAQTGAKGIFFKPFELEDIIREMHLTEKE